MSLYHIIFPDYSRTFRHKRWVKISLRILHLIGISGACSGYYFKTAEELWLPFMFLTTLSGILFMILEIWTNGIWLIQIRGIAIFIKIILLTCLPYFNGYESITLFIVIIISGLISHAPGDVRYFSVIHGRRLEKLNALSNIDNQS